MNISELNKKLEQIDAYFRAGDPTLTEKERLLTRLVKLNEEVGELCEAALCENDKNQRAKEKDIDFDAELADIIICTLLLALHRKKDVWSQVDKKIDKQFQRFGLV